MSKSRSRVLELNQIFRLLSQRLSTLSDKVSHQVIIPFTKKAFMPGRLVHTNEVMVLLGDNWFVERSAKQARLDIFYLVKFLPYLQQLVYLRLKKFQRDL